MASDDEEPVAKRQTYYIPASEDDGEDRIVWEVVECVLPNCTKTNLKKAQVWSFESEEDCTNQFLKHAAGSGLHWHMKDEEVLTYMDKLEIVTKTDTYKDREAYRKQMLASAPPEPHDNGGGGKGSRGKGCGKNGKKSKGKDKEKGCWIGLEQVDQIHDQLQRLESMSKRSRVVQDDPVTLQLRGANSRDKDHEDVLAIGARSSAKRGRITVSREMVEAIATTLRRAQDSMQAMHRMCAAVAAQHNAAATAAMSSASQFTEEAAVIGTARAMISGLLDDAH
jgi:hypothetical protein